jgi:hypothetical protein
MKKSKAILNLNHAGILEVKTKAEVIINRVTISATFATPSPTMAVVQAAVTVLSKAITERDGALVLYQQKSLEAQIEKDNVINILETLGNYVETTANGDAAKIISAGYDVKKSATPIGAMDVPINVLAKEGVGAGNVVITWKAVKGAKAYNLEQTDDITKPENWIHVATVTKAKCEVNGQISGVRYWYRVAAIGAAGQGAASDVTTRIIP